MGEAKRRREAAAGGASVASGFNKYSNQARKVLPNLSDLELGEGWMRREVRRKGPKVAPSFPARYLAVCRRLSEVPSSPDNRRSRTVVVCLFRARTALDAR